MIEVKNLSKDYGSVRAVDHISFSIAAGEIVGFLGPNGAGKTTTFRILANYFPQTSGEVSILGLDNRTRSLEIRRRIGYLPENNPLWPAMEVTEYLSFLWDVRGLGSGGDKRERMKEVIASCGLKEAVGSDIGELSRGYRQRVGLAAALLHDPEVLLLDEPTSGLDPIQAREVRELIQGLQEKKTILLSTHILSEAQAIANRVLIIHKGRLVADQNTAELVAGGQEFVITVHFSKSLSNGAAAALEGIRGIQTVEGPFPVADDEYSYCIRANSDLRSEIFQCAIQKKLPLLELRMEKKSLEEVFHELTQNRETENVKRETEDAEEPDAL